MVTRRALFALVAAGGVHGCASDTAPAGQAPRDEPLLAPTRSVGGGFIAAPSPGPGLPARPSGAYAKLVSPGAVALRDGDLLVTDRVGQRLWRADLFAGTFSAIAGAPVNPNTALALGADGSAWVLDTVTRSVLRFARDGRLLQTFRVDTAIASPVALALVDAGATLLLADGLGAQWSEQRGPGGIVQFTLPARDGVRVGGVDGLAPARDGVWVLDRLAGVVHRVARDGRVLETLGRNELAQPRAIAADRFDRVFVLDPADQALKLLHGGRPTVRLPLAALGVRQPSALASDGGQLAIGDGLTGQVLLFRIGRGEGA